MNIAAAPSIAIEIDGISADISSHVVFAAVVLQSGATGDSATVEFEDSAGTIALPRRDAGMRVFISEAEVFDGRIALVSGEGTDKGRTLRLVATAQSSPPATGLPTLACVWGRNLVSFSVAAKLEPPDPGDDMTAGTLTLTSHPALRPGMRITVAGARAQIDGEYLVDTVSHTFNPGAGFSTSLRIRRP
jgi:hypothetical protein